LAVRAPPGVNALSFRSVTSRLVGEQPPRAAA